MEHTCPKCSQPVEDKVTVCPRCRWILVREDELPCEEFSDDIIPDGSVLADEYKIVRLLGRGGAGRVYEARQTTLQDMRVALKVLHPDINQNEAGIALLKKEVIISRELTHENIIKVYSLEEFMGRHFLVMEYVEGLNLTAILKKLGKLTVRQFCPIFLQVCEALDYAHNRGIVHLDIKPGNIMLGTAGNVKLCDFGIARMVLTTVTTATQRLITGSLGYMPPEQYSGRRFVTLKSDIFALGATAYHMLVGYVPAGHFERDDVPQCVLRAMEPGPEDRFDSVKEFRDAFLEETGTIPVDAEEIRTLVAVTSCSQEEIIRKGAIQNFRLTADTITIQDDLTKSLPEEKTPSVPVPRNLDQAASHAKNGKERSHLPTVALHPPAQIGPPD